LRWKIKRAKLWHWLFLAAVFFKWIDGSFEFLGGLILFLFTNNTLVHWVKFLFVHELEQKPTDPIIEYILNFIHVSENTQLFAGAYLTAHGIVKVFLAMGLFFRKLWVYPLAIIILFLFIGYQLYRFVHTYSILLLFLTILDSAVIFLIYKEYKRIKL
jgi:uncharacterized membrane protein